MLTVTLTRCFSSVSGLCQKMENLQSDRIRPNLLGRIEDDHELVATDPGHGVALAHAFRQPLGEGAEHEVTELVSTRVIDILEAVDVHEQDGEDAADRLARNRAGSMRSTIRKRFGRSVRVS